MVGCVVIALFVGCLVVRMLVERVGSVRGFIPEARVAGLLVVFRFVWIGPVPVTACSTFLSVSALSFISIVA